MKNVLLLGKPGSGKGTIAKLLEKQGYSVLSGSDILRENSQSPDATYYKEAKEALDSGVLISSELINLMVSEKINQIGVNQPFVFDGYPRTVEQVEHLFTIFPKENIVTFYLDADDDVLEYRVVNRLTCKGCAASYHKMDKKPSKSGICDDCGGELYQRIDDNKETLKKRLEQYATNTQPIITKLEEDTMFIRIQQDHPSLLEFILLNTKEKKEEVDSQDMVDYLFFDLNPFILMTISFMKEYTDVDNVYEITKLTLRKISRNISYKGCELTEDEYNFIIYILIEHREYIEMQKAMSECINKNDDSKESFDAVINKNLALKSFVVNNMSPNQ